MGTTFCIVSKILVREYTILEVVHLKVDLFQAIYQTLEIIILPDRKLQLVCLQLMEA
jgi:hypothetical protein